MRTVGETEPLEPPNQRANNHSAQLAPNLSSLTRLYKPETRG